MTETQQIWKNRIIGYANVPPGQLVENELNWRLHTHEQEGILEALLSEIGYVQNVIVNLTTSRYETAGEDVTDPVILVRTDTDVPTIEHIRLLEPHLVDGHLRRNTALKHGQPAIPVTFVDLSLEEEQEILATLDPIGAMAKIDAGRLRALHEGLRVTDESLQTFLADIADEAGLYIQVFTPSETGASYVDNPYEDRAFHARKQVALMFSMEDFALFTDAVKQLSAHYALDSMTDTVLTTVLEAAKTIPEPKVGPARERKPKAEKLPVLNVPPKRKAAAAPAPEAESEPQADFFTDEAEGIPELV